MIIIFLILLINVNAFIKIDNNVFIDENNNERIFHGINTGNKLNITEMMVLFWHDHFATSAQVIKFTPSMYLQNQLF